MPQTKKFIDKKKAVTFDLVHRSQHDPLVADESAPQRVLLPSVTDKSTKGQKETLHLPSSVFASTVEEKVGLLNKAAPESGLRLDLDPDIVAAMDEDFDYSNTDNLLEDNFVELANQSSTELEISDNETNSLDSYDNEYADDDGSDNDIKNMNNGKTESRMTDMSCSVISRNSQLTLLDEKFDQMCLAYDDCVIGALECDDIEGEIDVNSPLFEVASEDFKKYKNQDKCWTDEIEKLVFDSSEESGTEHQYKLEVKEKNKWDCESVLSTYSNIYNHPRLIKEPVNKIEVNKRTGIPIESVKLTKKALSRLDNSTVTKNSPSILSTPLSVLSVRNKNESLEDKRSRKLALKQYRKIRRFERKANADAFKEEKKKLEKVMIFNKLNRRGIKL